MLDYHVVLGVVAIIAGLVGEAWYLWYFYRGSIKPHPFSWLGWGFLDAVVFPAQIVSGGGAGSWSIGVAAFVNTGIGIFSLRYGEKRITWSDWVCFLGTLVGIGLWVLTDDPLYAVIVATIANGLSFIPTFRKTYARPEEESLSIYCFDVAKFILGVAALEVLTPTTALFPAILAIVNMGFIAMVLLRRRQLRG